MIRFLVILLIGFISCQKSTYKGELISNEAIIKTHLSKITGTEEPRNANNIHVLNQVADYIFEVFNKYADTVYYQPFDVDGKTYKNVVAVFADTLPATVVIGAHYDVCGNQQGADDNASGVVGLLELARLLKGQPLNNRIELVAYTLEEPPFFRSEFMGSYIHAKSLKESKREVKGMICLEMIGYFSNEKYSQDYPVTGMGMKYGNQGNFIALIGKWSRGAFVNNFTKQFKNQQTIKTVSFFAPESITGIDFSDHLNYWHFGFQALMITDTSFYRNKNYHKSSDKIETLNTKKMAQVIDGVYLSLLNI